MTSQGEKLPRDVLLGGVRIPTFFYGTAWKEADTERLTSQALALGFRAIDTANQRRHYLEVGVGAALSFFVAGGGATREELFLQTKFTHVDGQDHRIPYDTEADAHTQVRQSFASSLEHLRTNYLDSYVLHGPSQRRGLAAADREAWRAMTELQRAGRVRLLGVSNVAPDQLEEFSAAPGGPPAFVQNRCYASKGWDKTVRELCAKHGILYQGFSLLTANREVLTSSVVSRVARRIGATPAQVVFRFALEAGMLPLTGTSSAEHGRTDLGVYELPSLTDDERAQIEKLGAG